jgi:hypothetical protein
MKKLITQAICLLALVLITNTGYTQKMVLTPSDAPKLVENKGTFIDKPLKNLLSQINPKINYVSGNPERYTNASYLTFYFVTKEDGVKVIRNTGKYPMGIYVTFQYEENNNHQPLPQGGILEWTSKDTEEYGDMIIMDIRIVGDINSQ